MDASKKFRLMSDILRASHFEWRRAASAACPGIAPAELVRAYWREVAKDTAEVYARKIDPAGDVARQFAELFVVSSLAMNEDAAAEGKDAEGYEVVVHRDCPWVHWHRRMDLLDEDRMGCDEWLRATAEGVNQRLGTRISVETVETLPEGAPCCRRRFRAG